MYDNTTPVFSDLAAEWPSSYVAREEIKKFTGGIIHPKTLANLDSQGKGPKGRIKVGRKVAYAVQPFIEWLQQRTKVLD